MYECCSEVLLHLGRMLGVVFMVQRGQIWPKNTKTCFDKMYRVPFRSATRSFEKCHPFLSEVPPVPFRCAPVPLRCAPVPLRCATRSFQKCHLSFYMCRRFSKFIGLQDFWTAFIHLMDVPFKNFWSFYDDHNVISMISFLLPACKYFHPCWFPFYSRDGAQQRSREWAS